MSRSGKIAGRHGVLAQSAVCALLLLVAMQAVPSMAGTITLAWDPVTSPELAGYRIYTGTESGAYSQVVDVGPADVMHSIAGLNDCATYYLAMKSLAGDGSESADFSAEVVGFTRPALSLVQPGLVTPGSTVVLTLDGTSFQDGATLSFSVSGISASAVSVESCGRASATITVASNALLGPVDISIVNPGNVPGTLTAAMSITTDAGPVVSSSLPADGAVDIQPATSITATFDRVLLANSVSSTTILLLDASGIPVPQAAGSPALSGNVVTLQPAAPLAQANSYRLQILGGDSGVKDTAGVPMASTFLQVQGFLTLNTLPSEVDNLHRTDVSGG
jgi:hypothetical protein